MLRTLIDRPTTVIVASATAVVLGAFSLLRLPVSLLPTLERPRLAITVEDADRSREELVQDVVEPLELRLAALRGATGVRSMVDDGQARLVIESEWQTDADRLRIEAERRLSEVAGQGVDALRIETTSGDRAPVIEVAVLPAAAAGEVRASEVPVEWTAGATRFVDRTLIPELTRLPGAGVVRRVGGARLRVVVEPLGAALAARGLSASEVVARLERVGRTRPLGAVRDGSVVRPVVVHARVSSLDELGALRLGEGEEVELRDVARFELREEVDAGAYRLDGRDAVLVEVFRAPGANAVLLSREVRSRVEALRAQVSPGVELRVVADGSREVIAALGQLGLAALVGLILGTLVLRWFLGSWRPTLALVVVVPSSISAAFGAFLIWGVSLDVVSLAGLALALGMLVDNGIVVLESIERASESGDGESAGGSVVAGTAAVSLALVAGFLTTAAVFVPLLYLRGLARAFFGVQAFAIVSSLALSLAFSLTLTPVLVRLLSGAGRRRLGRRAGRQPGRRWYLAVLGAALARPWWTTTVFVAVTVGMLALGLEALPRELVSAGAGSAVRLDFELAEELSASSARERARAIDRAVRASLPDRPGVGASTDVRYRAEATAEELDGGSGSRWRFGGRVRVPAEAFAASGESSRELGRRLPSVATSIRDSVQGSVPGVGLEASVEPTLLASGFAEAGGQWQLVASASTRERAERLAQRIVRVLREDAGLGVERPDEGRRRTAYRLGWRPELLAEGGADRTRIEAALSDALGGFEAGQMSGLADGRLALAEPRILVEATRAPSPELLPIGAGAESTSRPLGAVARLERDEREPAWQRRDGRPGVALLLGGPVLGGSARGLRPERIERALGRLALEADERWELAGAGHELVRSFGQLRLALALGVLLVFLTVAALYESLTLPIAVMATVPVSAAGALGALVATGQALNVMSFLGVILLAGIVVNNAIVLLHRLELERRQGGGEESRSGLVKGTLEAAAARYRPIVMTTLTTVLGMAPLAWLGGEGAELRRALAVAVTGGMVTGTLASLVLVPALYVVVRRRGSRLTRRGRRASKVAP